MDYSFGSQYYFSVQDMVVTPWLTPLMRFISFIGEYTGIFCKIAEEENIARSQNIIMGLKMRAQSGSLRNFDRICYGYQHENKMLVPSFRAKYVKKNI